MTTLVGSLIPANAQVEGKRNKEAPSSNWEISKPSRRKLREKGVVSTSNPIPTQTFEGGGGNHQNLPRMKTAWGEKKRSLVGYLLLRREKKRKGPR